MLGVYEGGYRLSRCQPQYGFNRIEIRSMPAVKIGWLWEFKTSEVDT
jgi:hypothetical protein